jgi:protein involved in polysaccharide export with SLBB domain
MNIPFRDIALANGSVIEVEQINPQVFTVIGLVRRAGAFPYPPKARYTLLDALGFAGGVDEIIDPRFVRVYPIGNPAGSYRRIQHCLRSPDFDSGTCRQDHDLDPFEIIDPVRSRSAGRYQTVHSTPSRIPPSILKSSTCMIGFE